MPGVQVVDLSPTRAPETTLEKVLGTFASSYSKKKKEGEEQDALRDIYQQFQNTDRGIEETYKRLQTTPGLSPTTRVEQTRHLLELKKHNAAEARAFAAQSRSLSSQNRETKPDQSLEESDDIVSRLVEEGLPENEAKIYATATPGVKQAIIKRHYDLMARGERAPEREKEISDIQQVQDEKPEFPEISPPRKMTSDEFVKWENTNQKENNKILKETREKTRSNKNAEIHINRLSDLTEKVPDDIGRIVINPMTGEPYSVAMLAKLGVDKHAQAYLKTVNDFMIDAKSFFGSRVTNFDVQAFKSRLPTLLNTADGRRVILKQMSLLNELELLHNESLENGLKHYGRKASYSDIQAISDDNTKEKSQEIIRKINTLNTASEYMDLMASDKEKFKDKKLMQTPDGEFRIISNEDMNDALDLGWRIY